MVIVISYDESARVHEIAYDGEEEHCFFDLTIDIILVYNFYLGMQILFLLFLGMRFIVGGLFNYWCIN